MTHHIHVYPLPQHYARSDIPQFPFLFRIWKCSLYVYHSCMSATSEGCKMNWAHTHYFHTPPPFFIKNSFPRIQPNLLDNKLRPLSVLFQRPLILVHFVEWIARRDQRDHLGHARRPLVRRSVGVVLRQPERNTHRFMYDRFQMKMKVYYQVVQT